MITHVIGKKLDELIVKSSQKKDGKRKTEYRVYSIIQPDSVKLCLLLPPWHISKVLWNRLQKRLLRQGYSLVVVEASENILSNDAEQIIANFRKVRKLAFDEIRRVKSLRTIENIDVIGLSLGTVSALYVAVSGLEINRLILISPADDLAEGIWNGIRTKDIRKSLVSKGATLGDFQNSLQEMTMRKKHEMKVKMAYLYLSEEDSIIPFELGKQLETIFQEYMIPVTTISNRNQGHYLTFINFCLRAKI